MSRCLPDSQQQCQNNSQRMQGRLHVIVEEFRIAENKSRSEVVVGVPGGERNDRNEQNQRGLPTGKGTSSSRAPDRFSSVCGFSRCACDMVCFAGVLVPSLAGLALVCLLLPALPCRAFMFRRFAAGENESPEALLY